MHTSYMSIYLTWSITLDFNEGPFILDQIEYIKLIRVQLRGYDSAIYIHKIILKNTNMIAQISYHL